MGKSVYIFYLLELQVALTFQRKMTQNPFNSTKLW